MSNLSLSCFLKTMLILMLFHHLIQKIIAELWHASRVPHFNQRHVSLEDVPLLFQISGSAEIGQAELIDLSWSNLWEWLQLSDQLEAGQGCPRLRWLGLSPSSSWAQIFHMVRSKCCKSHWEIKHSDLCFVLLSVCHIKIDQVICKSSCSTCQLNIPWKRSKAHSADGVILVSLSKSIFMPRCSSNFDPVCDFHSETKYFSVIFLPSKNHSTLGT